MDFYTINELRNLSGLENPERIRYYSAGLGKQLKLLKPFIPDLDIHYRCYFDEDKIYIDTAFLLFTRNDILFRVSYCDKSGLSIHVLTHHLQNISTYDYQKAERELVKPDTIRKFNQKKIDSLIDYQTAYYNNLQEISDTNTLEINLFRKKVESWNDVHWFGKDKNEGEVIRNGLKYSFRIKDGCIDTKVSVYYQNEHSVSPEDFAALADNKFVMKSK